MRKFLMMRGLILLICLLPFTEGIAQNYARHNWYFGSSVRGIRFSRTDNTASVTNKFMTLGVGGSAVATDQTNANLLFYSDGTQVINLNHQIMAGGGGLFGNAGSNQPVAISPIPGQPSQYYVFTNTASFATATVGVIRFSIVDMSLAGGSPFPTPPIGAVTTKNDASISLNARSEAMITVPHENGDDYWLITHESGTDNYTSTLITATGFTDFPQNGKTGISIAAANFAYYETSPTAGKIAVTPQDANRNVAILTIDRTDGTLTLDSFVPNSATLAAQGLYDTEWSADGRFLYISREADVVQYDSNNPANSLTSVLNSLGLVKSYGLQVAPDTAIYHLYESSAGVFRLGRLTDIDSVASNVIYTPNAFSAFDYDGKQFPQFTASMTILPSVTFTYKGSCTNSPISFYPTVTPGADSLVWDFGDGSPTSSEWSPMHTYQAAGATVTVTPYLNGVAGTPAQQVIGLTDFDLQLTLVSDTTACSCSLPMPISNVTYQAPPDPAYCQPFTVTATAQGGASPTYQWYGPEGKIIGATSLTLQPQSAGYYWLVATSGLCESYAAVNIREYGVQDQRANMWYFGNKAGLDFNEQPAVPISNPFMVAPEGTATICDRNGQVLFFTDGNTIWNRAFAVIGTGIGGDLQSAQSSLIIPVPGDETLYYVFTTQDVGAGRYELRYSLYDIKKNFGAGALVEFNQLLYTPATERITSDGTWLIAHEYGNNSFRAYPISTNGIGNPVISSVGSDHSFSPATNGEGYMKVSGGELAVALSNASGNFVEIFDFDNATGEVSDFRSVNLNAPVGQVYGIEFSGDKIFATVRGVASSQIFEILDTLGAAPTIIKIPPITVAAELGALQMGPDGQIYVAVNGATTLGAINVNPDPAVASLYNPNGSPPLLGNSLLGLPNFAQQVGVGPMTPAYLITGLCLGYPTDFAASGTDIIDKFLWSITQGATQIVSSDQQAFSFTLPAAGDYTVTLLISNGCGYRASFTETITIVPPPQMPLDVPFCPQDVIVLDANPNNAPGLTYLWRNGATTETIIVTQRGSYPVTITTPEGCSINAAILAIDVGSPIDLGPDLVVCTGATAPTQLDGQINTKDHNWSLSTNGGVFTSLNNDFQLQPVDLSTAGTFAYLDIYSNQVTGCISRDTITFTVNQTPVFTATAPAIACGATTQITLNISQSASSLFTYTLIPTTGSTITATSQNPNQNIFIPGLAAGTYSMVVTDQISSCSDTTIIPINTNAFTVAATQADACPDSRIQVTALPASGNNYHYIIRDASLTSVDDNFSTSPFTTTKRFPAGDYNVELSFGGCTSSASLTIAPTLPNAPVAFTLDVCNSQVSVDQIGLSYTWTTIPANGINSGGNLQTVILNPGTWDLSVNVSDLNSPPTTYCPAFNSITVTVDGLVMLDILPDDLCQDVVTLSAVATTTANPPISFNYEWELTAAPGTTVGIGEQLVITQSDDYTLNAVSALSGCTHTTTKSIDIIGEKTVTIESALACEGSFLVTAIPSEPVSSDYTWTLDGNPLSGVTNQITGTKSGLYRVEVFIIGCLATYEVPITTLPRPIGSLPNTALICNDPDNADPATKEVYLNAAPTGGDVFTYQWYLGPPPPTAIVGETEIDYTVTVPGLYTVEMFNSFGCKGTDQTDVIPECIPFIVAPTAFRPGSIYESNSVFYVIPVFIADADFQLFIFNRWGEMVHQGTGVDHEQHQWNGGYKNNLNQPLPAGTYTYIVKFRSLYRPQDGIQEKRGGVVLLR